MSRYGGHGKNLSPADIYEPNYSTTSTNEQVLLLDDQRRQCCEDLSRVVQNKLRCPLHMIFRPREKCNDINSRSW